MAIKLGLLDTSDVVEAVNDRSIDVKVVLTGRCAPSELLAVADYITEMKALRHPYEKGTLSREGVDR